MFADEEGIVGLYFMGMVSIDPEICSKFAVLISHFVTLAYAEVLLAYCFSLQIDWIRVLVNPFLDCFLLTAKNCSLHSRERKFSAFRLIIRHGLAYVESKLKKERVIGQFDEIAHRLIGLILCVLHISECEPFRPSDGLLHITIIFLI